MHIFKRNQGNIELNIFRIRECIGQITFMNEFLKVTAKKHDSNPINYTMLRTADMNEQHSNPSTSSVRPQIVLTFYMLKYLFR